MTPNDSYLYFSCYCETESINVTYSQCNIIKETLTNMECETEDNVTRNRIEFDLIVDVVLILLVGLFGLCGNIGAIHRFSHLKKATKFHHLMMLLSIYDLLCIATIVSIFSLPRVSSVYKQSAFYHYFAPIALSLTQIALTGSIYTTLAITIERYLIVCHPFYVVSHEWPSKRYILPVSYTHLPAHETLR